MSRWGEAKIVRMDITSFGEPKYGDSVSNVPIDYNGPWIADLDNGHWAYGSQIINSLIARIEKLEARPTFFQRKSVYGEPTGIVYTHGQTKAHSP